MEDKNKIIILVAVIAVIAIAGILFATGMLNGNNNQMTTQFKTDFMEGSFVGNVSLENDTQKFMHSYEDKNHHITYNISTVDNSSELMEIYQFQGVPNPEERTFNGIDWNIYFTQAIPGNDTSDTSNAMNIVICESQGEKQGYLIYAIFDAKSDINSTNNIFSDGYINYIEPLLKSITLKESKDVPKINEEFGLSEDEFAQQLDMIRQYNAGNTSVLEG